MKFVAVALLGSRDRSLREGAWTHNIEPAAFHHGPLGARSRTYSHAEEGAAPSNIAL